MRGNTATGPTFCTLMLLALAGTVLLGCTSAPVARSTFVQGTDFSTFKTFSFLETDVLVVSSPSPVNPALQPILMEETQAYLTKKGYRYAPTVADADFTIGFSVGGNPSMRTTVFGDNYNQVWIIGEGVQDMVVTQESTQAGLMIDFYDSAGNKKWMGWALDEVTYSDQVRLRSTVKDIVAIILKHFPPENAPQPG